MNYFNKIIFIVFKTANFLMNSSRERSLSGRRASSQKRSHIVQQSLNRKSQLIDKYQNQIQDLIEQIDTKIPPKRSSTHTNNNSSMQRSTKLRTINRSRLSASMRNQTIQPQKDVIMTGSMKDYQKLILGLQYALQSQRKKTESLQQKNSSLEVEISNLRNVLVGPNEIKQYQKTILKQMQQKTNQLEDKIIEQKKNYEFIIDSKNQALTSLQSQLRILQKQFTSKSSQNDKKGIIQSKENTLTKKILDLMSTIEQLRTTITQKNIQIQSLRYRKIDYQPDSGEQSDQEIKKIHNVDKIRFYLEQLQTANKMIIKKNIQILNLSNKMMKFEEVIDLIEMYLDKKQVKNVDLNVLETPVITKLRILLRQKATFQRELLTQLNEHNKKISHFQTQLTSKQSLTTVKLSQAISDNKKLSALVSTLQLNIKNLQKTLHDQKRQNQYLKNEVEINKKQFIQEMKKVKGELGTISSVTKNQFDRMKLQNLKLSEQNRSLLFLVGQKERQLHRKGETIKTFEDYKQKINSLDTSIAVTQRRKVQRSVEYSPQLGSKILLISNFSGWIFQWRKIKSWSNKKVLLNLILDRQQIRRDAIGQIPVLIEVLHECLLESRNVEIQQRATILLSFFISENLLQQNQFYLDKVVAILVRGFRQQIEGEQEEKLRLLNQSTLKIFAELQKLKYKWTNELTNEMLAVNGLKYLFTIVNSQQIDDLIEMAYDVLICIARNNQMVSFMVSYNMPEIILKNLQSKYTFIVYLLELLKCLLQSNDFLRTQKSFLQYRKLTLLLKQSADDDQIVMLALECLQILMQGSTAFLKALNKVETVSYLNNLIKVASDVKLLKKVAFIYGVTVENMDEDSIDKFIKLQFPKILQTIQQKNISRYQFIVSLKITLKVTQEIIQNNELDQKIVQTCFQLYELYQSLQQKSRLRLNQIIDTIYQRNKLVINKFSSNTFITNFVESYKSTNVIEQVLILLKILLFENEQKQTTELLRSGRESLIQKLITDSMSTKNYTVSILALKNLLALARQKYIEKFMNVKIVSKIINKVLKERTEEQYLSLTVSVLYFISKNQPVSQWVVQSKGIEKVTEVMIQRHDKQALIVKCFALLELLHSTNYKKKVLNYYLTDPKLQSIKTFNYILRRAVNKTEMGARVVFLFDFLLQKSSIQSLMVSMVENDWMVEDMILTRNQYIGKADSLVYKIEVLLNQVCGRSKKLNKIYQQFKVQGDISSGDQGQ